MVKTKKKEIKTPQKNHHALLLITTNHRYYYRYRFYCSLLLPSIALHVDVASKYFLNLTCAFAPCTIITTYSALFSKRFSFTCHCQSLIIICLTGIEHRASSIELSAISRHQHLLFYPLPWLIMIISKTYTVFSSLRMKSAGRTFSRHLIREACSLLQPQSTTSKFPYFHYVSSIYYLISRNPPRRGRSWRFNLSRWISNGLFI